MTKEAIAGFKGTDNNGWYIVDGSGELIYLKDNKEKYVEVYKQYNATKTVDEFSPVASKFINADE